VKQILARFTFAVALLACTALTLGAGIRWSWWRISSRLRPSDSGSRSWCSPARRSCSKLDSAGA